MAEKKPFIPTFELPGYVTLGGRAVAAFRMLPDRSVMLEFQDGVRWDNLDDLLHHAENTGKTVEFRMHPGSLRTPQ